MSKHKLKLIEPSPQDRLESAIAVAVKAREDLSTARATFAKRFPGDHRLLENDLAGTTLSNPDRDPNDHGAELHSKRVEFLKERENVSALLRLAQEADNAVDALRAQAEASVTEDERRATLAAAIDGAARTARAVESIRSSVDRARAALSAAETRLSEVSIAEEAARKAKAGKVLEAIEADMAIEPDATLRQARDAKIEASDDVSFARDALSAVETKLRNAEEVLRGSGDQILACAKAVTASAIPRLLEAAQAMQRDLEARRQVLRVLDHFSSDQIINPVDRDREIADFLAGTIFPFEWNGGRSEDHPAAVPWLDILEALQNDATAPLPE